MIIKYGLIAGMILRNQFDPHRLFSTWPQPIALKPIDVLLAACHFDPVSLTFVLSVSIHKYLQLEAITIASYIPCI